MAEMVAALAKGTRGSDAQLLTDRHAASEMAFHLHVVLGVPRRLRSSAGESSRYHLPYRDRDLPAASV